MCTYLRSPLSILGLMNLSNEPWTMLTMNFILLRIKSSPKSWGYRLKNNSAPSDRNPTNDSPVVLGFIQIFRFGIFTVFKFNYPVSFLQSPVPLSSTSESKFLPWSRIPTKSSKIPQTACSLDFASLKHSSASFGHSSVEEWSAVQQTSKPSVMPVKPLSPLEETWMPVNFSSHSSISSEARIWWQNCLWKLSGRGSS